MPLPQEPDFGQPPYRYRHPDDADQNQPQSGVSPADVYNQPASVTTPGSLQDVSDKLDVLIQLQKDLLSQAQGIPRSFRFQSQSIENLTVAANSKINLLPLSLKGPLYLASYAFQTNANTVSLQVNVDDYVETASISRLNFYSTLKSPSQSNFWPLLTVADPINLQWSFQTGFNRPSYIQRDFQLNLYNTGSNPFNLAFFRVYYYQRG